MPQSTLLKSLAYGVLDAATVGRGVRRVIGGEAIRFPARWCRYYPSDYEPTTFDFLRKHCRPGDIVLDIGAHFGLFSVVMARRVAPTGRVFSFEPTALTRQVLTETVRLNGYSHIVQIRTEAVTHSTGTMTFYETGDIVSNANSLARTNRSQTTTTVPTVSIDNFVRANSISVRCMKIDVEGAELDALRGARQTLQLCRPAMHLSLHPNALQQTGGTLADIWAILENCRMAVVQKGETVDARWFCSQTNLFEVQLLPYTLPWIPVSARNRGTIGH